MTGRPVAWLDVFAERPLAGNGVAVVGEADGVSDETMLAFAKETKLSESTFVQTTYTEGADYRNRIWTPAEELPFAGHPSLGTAVAVARWRGLDEAGFTQETGAGLQPVDVRREGNSWHASILQNECEFGAELDPAAAMAALGLEPGDAHPDLAPQMASTGIFHGFAPLADESALGRIVPDYPAIDALMEPHGGIVLYPFFADPDAGRAHARSLAGDLGEDPATGSAAGPLCAYLDRYAGCSRVTIRQGEEMGRPSVLEAEMEHGRPRVSGSVFPLMEGTVELPG